MRLGRFNAPDCATFCGLLSFLMTRYKLLLHYDEPEYLAACYAKTGPGVYSTFIEEDACSWAMIESAARVARHVAETLNVEVSIQHCSA